MSLTQCPDSLRLRFHNTPACAGCGREFRAGELRAKAAAGNRSLTRGAQAVFLVSLAILLVTLLLVLPRIA